jgi:hypothetical protein
MGYRNSIPKLLKLCGWEVISEQFTEIDDPDPEQLREKQHALMEEFDEARKQMEAEAERVESEAASERRKSKLFGWLKPKKKDWWDMASAEKQSSTEQGGEDMFNVEAIMHEVNAISQEKRISSSSKLPDEVPITAVKTSMDADDISMSFEPYEDDEVERNAKLEIEQRPLPSRESKEPLQEEKITMMFE